MTLKEAEIEVKKIAKRCEYRGDLSDDSIKECADVYIANCDDEGTPKPRHYMRSEGNQTNLNEIQWLLVRTPSFKKWFGDSVVKDANGEPKVMYHGTWKSFTEFKPSSIKLSKVAMTLWSGPGFYFTDSEKVAKIYAGNEGDNIYDVFLKIENPLIVDETGNAEGKDGISKKDAERIFLAGDNTQWLDSGLANELARMDEEDGVKNGGKHHYKGITREQRVKEYVSRLKTDVVKLKTAALAYGAKSQAKLLENVCKFTGHDGVIHTITPEVKEWVVYNPVAIKSASSNSGEYSPKKTKTEDSAEMISNESKGGMDMGLKAVVDALSGMFGAPAENHEEAMDIVDRNGRHHEPKGIPPGGQFEEEGKYLTGNAKFEHALNQASTGKYASMLREHVAPLYAAMGKDSQKRAMIQKIHEDIRGLSKDALKRGMVRHRKDMDRHIKAFNEIKDMDKEQFRAWLQEHPEYNTELTAKLMNDSRYNKHYAVKGGYHDDGTGQQKHEAWEEAKWNVGARVMTSMILFQEHADALHGAPDGIMANMIASEQEEAPLVERNEQTPPQEQITAGRNDDISTMAEIMSDDLGELANIDTVIDAYNNDDRTEFNRMVGQLSDEAVNSITSRLGGNNPLSEAIHSIRSGGNVSTTGASNNLDFEGAARQFAEHNNTTYSDSHATEFKNFVEKAQRGELDMSPAGGGTRSNDMQFYEDIKAALGEEHPVVQALTSAVMEQRRHMPEERNDDGTPVEGQTEQTVSAEETQPSDGPTYTDRDGVSHPLVHNEGGLKAPLHQSEIGAVQAEMAKAFADAANDVEGAEEYAHALSHFLGRGQDNRSPHPGMRQEGLLKHQLADKMQTRLEEKASAVGAAEGADAIRDAVADMQATEKAVKTIADRCGITPDMLPEGTNFNRVRLALGAPIRAANPDNQEAVNALHSLANPEPEVQTQEENTSSESHGAEEQHANAEPEHTEMPSAEQIRSLAQRIQQNAGGMANASVIEEVITDLANGRSNGRLDGMGMTPEQAMEQFGRGEIANDPTFQALMNRVRNQQTNAQSAQQSTQEQTQHEAQPQSEQVPTNQQTPNQMAATTANANPSLNRTVNENGEVRYDLGVSNQHWWDVVDQSRQAHGQAYDWPFRRNQAPTAEQITPDLIRSVAFNLPSGGRRASSIADFGRQAMVILENPDTATRYPYVNTMRRIESSPNRHARRYMQILNALHPDFAQQRQRAEDARQARMREEERQRSVGRVDRAIESALANAPENASEETRVNITPEQSSDAVERIVQHLGVDGESRREQVQRAMDAFQRTGTVPTAARDMLADILPSDHPVMAAVRDAEYRQASERERKRIRARDFAPTIDASVKANNKSLAESNGLQYSETPISTDTPKDPGYNCYLAALVHSLRRAGINVPKVNGRPQGYGAESQKYFIPMKQAMANAGWKPVQGATREETIANLKELARTKPNGYTIECWGSDHHGTQAFLLDGEWIWNDPFFHDYNEPMTSERLANRIANVGRDGSSAGLNEGQKRLLSVAILKGLTPEQRRSMTPEQRQAYVDEKLKEGRYIAESSFGHDPSQGFTDEIIKQVLRT